MRGTNCKETRRAVEAYIMEEVSGVLDRCGVADALHPVDAAYRIMREEVAYQTDHRDGRDVIGEGIARKYREAGRTVSAAVARDPYLVWYLAAQAGSFEAYHDAARAHVAEWLDETPEDAGRYDGEKVWSLYVHLAAKAFERLHAKEA